MLPTSHWSELRENTCVWGIRILYTIHGWFGYWPFRLCLFPVVCFYWASMPLARRASREYLERLEAFTGVWGRKPNWMDTWRHIALFSETMLDKILAVSGRYPFQKITVSGEELLKDRFGQGGIIMTAHVGCLELCRSLAERVPHLHLHVLVHTQHAQEFNRLLDRFQPESRLHLMEVTDIHPGTATLLSSYVERGDFLAIAGDRVPVGGGKTVCVPFLGHDAPFPVGPYLLAHLLQCPLYLMVSVHEKKSYAVHMELLAEKVLVHRGNRKESFAEYARIFSDALARLLKQSPYDWFNFFSFWNQKHE